MASKGLTELWNAAIAAKPSDWMLMGVTCASTGLAPQQRSERWVAQACRSDGECLRSEADSPQDALAALTVKLRGLKR